MPNSAEILFRHFEVINATGASWESAWAETLGSPWIENVNGLLNLYDDTVRAVRSKVNVRSELLLRYAPEWRRAILLHGVAPDMTPRNSSGFTLSDDAIAGLYAVAVAMPGSSYTALAADVDNLRAAADRLHSEVLGATDLEDDVRSHLLTLVAKISFAIDHRGALGDQLIRDLATTTTGGAATNPNLWSRILHSKPKTAVVGVLVALGAAAGYVNDVSQAAETAYSVIEHVVNAGSRLELMAPAVIPAIEPAPSKAPEIGA